MEKAIAAFRTARQSLVSNAGIQTVAPLDQFRVRQMEASWLAIHLDGGVPHQPERRCARCTSSATGGSIIYMGSVHSKEGLAAEGALRDGPNTG